VRTVVNYDVARDIDTHTHRIGRTGRAGQSQGVMASGQAGVQRHATPRLTHTYSLPSCRPQGRGAHPDHADAGPLCWATGAPLRGGRTPRPRGSHGGGSDGTTTMPCGETSDAMMVLAQATKGLTFAVPQDATFNNARRKGRGRGGSRGGGRGRGGRGGGGGGGRTVQRTGLGFGACKRGSHVLWSVVARTQVSKWARTPKRLM
jgi:hypothetical protein